MIEKSLTLEMPWPPSANNNWMISKGRMISTPQVRSYKKTIAMLSYTWPRMTFKENITVDIIANPPLGKRKRDVDNNLKVLLDSLQKTHLFNDDNQISKITIERKEELKDGKIIIKLQGN